MQMKKTRDAARVIIERMYGAPPRFNYYIGNRLYLWKKEQPQAPAAPKAPSPVAAAEPQKLGLTQGKLRDLAWSLDIKDREPGA